MKLFLNDKEVTLAELKFALDNLDYGPPDGGTFEALELYDIKDGDMYFESEEGKGTTFYITLNKLKK